MKLSDLEKVIALKKELHDNEIAYQRLIESATYVGVTIFCAPHVAFDLSNDANLGIALGQAFNRQNVDLRRQLAELGVEVDVKVGED